MLNAEFHDRRTAAAFILRRLGDGGDVRMLLQHLAQGFAQDAHAAAVDDADAWQSGEEGAVDEFLDFTGSVVDGLSDNVDFAGDAGGFAVE